jgi:hypothetical protein
MFKVENQSTLTFIVGMAFVIGPLLLSVPVVGILKAKAGDALTALAALSLIMGPVLVGYSFVQAASEIASLSRQVESYLNTNYGLRIKDSENSSLKGSWLYHGKTINAVDTEGKTLRIRMVDPESKHPSIVVVTQVVNPLEAKK